MQKIDDVENAKLICLLTIHGWEVNVISGSKIKISEWFGPISTLAIYYENYLNIHSSLIGVVWSLWDSQNTESDWVNLTVSSRKVKVHCLQDSLWDLILLQNFHIASISLFDSYWTEYSDCINKVPIFEHWQSTRLVTWQRMTCYLKFWEPELKSATLSKSLSCNPLSLRFCIHKIKCE